MLLTATIDAREEHGVTTIDIPNPFFQTIIEHEEYCVVMHLRGKLSDLMVKVVPKIYTKCVTITSKGETILYVRLIGALYVIINSTLLYYKLFVKNPKSIGFALNPYDPFVANKMVRVKHLTVFWPVDDLKVGHHETSVVTEMAEWLKKTYARILYYLSVAMTLHCGKIHNYIGMNLGYSVIREVKI